MGILALAILGLSGWIVITRQDALQLVSAAAAKIVCSNVFIANIAMGATAQLQEKMI